MNKYRYQYEVTGLGRYPFPHDLLKDVTGDFRTLLDQQRANCIWKRTIGIIANHIDEHRWQAAGWTVDKIEKLA